MKNLFFMLIIFNQLNIKIEAKFVSVPNPLPAAYCSSPIPQNDASSDIHCASIISVYDLLKEPNAPSYIKYLDSMHLEFSKFPLASSPDSSLADPCIPETFILIIPHGRAFSSNGVILINDHLVKELIWQWSPLLRDSRFNLAALPPIKPVTGRVAVITQEGCLNYYHWMTEVLPKLAMLEAKNIHYDRLFVSTKLPFMRQTLDLLGVDSQKIIEAEDTIYIEADELIVPSAPSLSCYTPVWIADYLKNKFLPLAEQAVTEKPFNKRVFISRKKTSYRKMINEDDVFKMFEAKGFVRYSLEDLSFLEQILLFKNAEIVVAAHGAGLFNLHFSKPGTRVIEIFQEHEDDTYWYLSQALGLQHTCIKTSEFKKDGGLY